MRQLELSDFERTDWDYRDEADLRELYVRRELPAGRVGDLCDVTGATIRNWLREYEIPIRPSNYTNEPYSDYDTLYRHYVIEQLSQQDIADRYDVTHGTIQYWMEQHEIDARNRSLAGHLARGNYYDTPYYTRYPDGYEEFQSMEQTKRRSFLHHRLLAVAEYGFDAIRDMHAHHVIPVPWLNYRDNIELMTPSEHRKHHWNEYGR